MTVNHITARSVTGSSEAYGFAQSFSQFSLGGAEGYEGKPPMLTGQN